MRFRDALHIVAIVFPLLLVGPALSLDTAIPAINLKNRVPMTTLFYEGEPFDVPVRTPDFVVTEVADGSKVAQGRNKSGKGWRLSLPPATNGLWRAADNSMYLRGLRGINVHGSLFSRLVSCGTSKSGLTDRL